MKSDGGLCSFEEFSGCTAILSGPAGGIVGFSETSYPIISAFNNFIKDRKENPVTYKSLIGFDMGGTSTDVSRFDGKSSSMSYETQIDGIDIQVPHLEIGKWSNLKKL
jgi:5-oxoprolinase (ATP-hydrolysing)